MTKFIMFFLPIALIEQPKAAFPNSYSPPGNWGYLLQNFSKNIM